MAEKLPVDLMACRGADTKTVRYNCQDFEECEACGTVVVWDMVDHPFFGFESSCPHKKQAVIILDAPPADPRADALVRLVVADPERGPEWEGG